MAALIGERFHVVAYLAEPVETSALRGRKRGAKTDRTVWIGNFVPNLSRATSIVFCHSGRLRRTIVELSPDHGAWSQAAVSIDLKPTTLPGRVSMRSLGAAPIA